MMFLVLSGCQGLDGFKAEENKGEKMQTFFTDSNKDLPKLARPKDGYETIKNKVLHNDFIRTQASELESSFPKLQNPTLNMFIYPHLTEYGNPVPGYTTNFKLYRVDQYALPSEVL
jgi:conjugative transfer region lipoprotein (TIGR03751 family)